MNGITVPKIAPINSHSDFFLRIGDDENIYIKFLIDHLKFFSLDGHTILCAKCRKEIGVRYKNDKVDFFGGLIKASLRPSSKRGPKYIGQLQMEWKGAPHEQKINLQGLLSIDNKQIHIQLT